MKPHPRIRKTVKWGGAALTVLLAFAWFVSDRWWVNWDLSNGWHVELMDGHIRSAYFGKPGYQNPRSLYVQTPGSMDLRWVLYGGNGSERPWDIPLWLLTGGCLVAGAAAWHMDALARLRARSLNLCPKCSYDRAGIAGDAKCPECGAMPTSA